MKDILGGSKSRQGSKTPNIKSPRGPGSPRIIKLTPPRSGERGPKFADDNNANEGNENNEEKTSLSCGTPKAKPAAKGFSRMSVTAKIQSMGTMSSVSSGTSVGVAGGPETPAFARVGSSIAPNKEGGSKQQVGGPVAITGGVSVRQEQAGAVGSMSTLQQQTGFGGIAAGSGTPAAGVTDEQAGAPLLKPVKADPAEATQTLINIIMEENPPIITIDRVFTRQFLTLKLLEKIDINLASTTTTGVVQSSKDASKETRKGGLKGSKRIVTLHDIGAIVSDKSKLKFLSEKLLNVPDTDTMKEKEKTLQSSIMAEKSDGDNPSIDIFCERLIDLIYELQEKTKSAKAKEDLNQRNKSFSRVSDNALHPYSEHPHALVKAKLHQSLEELLKGGAEKQMSGVGTTDVPPHLHTFGLDLLVDWRDPETNDTVLMKIIKLGRTDWVKELLFGETFGNLGAGVGERRCDPATTEFLVANFDIPDSLGYTPIFRSVYENKLDIFKVLLDAKFDVNRCSEMEDSDRQRHDIDYHNHHDFPISAIQDYKTGDGVAHINATKGDMDGDGIDDRFQNKVQPTKESLLADNAGEGMRLKYLQERLDNTIIHSNHGEDLVQKMGLRDHRFLESLKIGNEELKNQGLIDVADSKEHNEDLIFDVDSAKFIDEIINKTLDIQGDESFMPTRDEINKKKKELREKYHCLQSHFLRGIDWNETSSTAKSGTAQSGSRNSSGSGGTGNVGSTSTTKTRRERGFFGKMEYFSGSVHTEINQFSPNHKKSIQKVRQLRNLRESDQQATSTGLSALMLAASRGNVQFVKLLLEHNADIHFHTPHGLTARDFAYKTLEYRGGQGVREVIEMIDQRKITRTNPNESLSKVQLNDSHVSLNQSGTVLNLGNSRMPAIVLKDDRGGKEIPNANKEMAIEKTPSWNSQLPFGNCGNPMADSSRGQHVSMDQAFSSILKEKGIDHLDPFHSATTEFNPYAPKPNNSSLTNPRGTDGDLKETPRAEPVKAPDMNTNANALDVTDPLNVSNTPSAYISGADLTGSLVIGQESTASNRISPRTPALTPRVPAKAPGALAEKHKEIIPQLKMPLSTEPILPKLQSPQIMSGHNNANQGGIPGGSGLPPPPHANQFSGSTEQYAFPSGFQSVQRPGFDGNNPCGDAFGGTIPLGANMETATSLGVLCSEATGIASAVPGQAPDGIQARNLTGGAELCSYKVCNKPPGSAALPTRIKKVDYNGQIPRIKVLVTGDQSFVDLMDFRDPAFKVGVRRGWEIAAFQILSFQPIQAGGAAVDGQKIGGMGSQMIGGAGSETIGNSGMGSQTIGNSQMSGSNPEYPMTPRALRFSEALNGPAFHIPLKTITFRRTVLTLDTWKKLNKFGKEQQQ